MIIATAVAGCSNTHRAADARFDAGEAEGDGSVRDAGDGYEPPPPVEIDRTGLIPTSGKQLLLIKRARPEVSTSATDVLALDLENGELHELASSVEMSEESPSPDSRTFMYSVSRAFNRPPYDFSMVRFLSDGVVPARLVSDVVERPGPLGRLRWIDDGRFAVLYHESDTGEDGLEVIDVHASAAHASIAAGDSAEPALAGLSFFYSVAHGDEVRAGYARITADGLDTHEVAAPDFYSTAFSADGARVLLRDLREATLREATQNVYFYRDLPSGEIVPIDPPGGDSTLELEFAGDRDHVVAYDDSEPAFVVSLATAESTPVALPSDLFDDFIKSRDGRIVRVVVRGRDQRKIVDPMGIEPAIAMEESFGDYGAAGAHHIFYSNPKTGFVIAGLDDSGALQRAVIGDGGEQLRCVDDDGGWTPSKQTANRLAYFAGGEHVRLGLVDLTEPLALEVRSIVLAGNGGFFGCPVWNAEGTAFAFAEQLNVGIDDNGDGEPDRYDYPESWIYVVHWPKDGSPGEPELVFNGEGWLNVVLAQP